VVAADRLTHLPGSIKKVANVCVGDVDVRDKDALMKLFQDHGDSESMVWNLASPLSVETALSPELAEAVTIGGMQNTIEAMNAVGARRICFTDSIGSFGATSPRSDVAARWLVENPTQDPGSDYGRQKRACRELMEDFRVKDGGDPRFAVLPGVLHSEPVWGNGTTEYALDALLAASRGQVFECPIDPDVMLPMVYADDLMRGLLALQFADESELQEPQRGYTIPGLSFTANQLFHEIKQHVPEFEITHKRNENMDKFAKIWPDDLSWLEAERDLYYEADVTLPRMVAQVLNAHSGRKINSRAAFRSIDTCESGRINDYMLLKFVRKYLVRGRERRAYTARRQDKVNDIVDKLMKEMDVDGDGTVLMDDFIAWSRIHNLESYVDDYMAENYA